MEVDFMKNNNLQVLSLGLIVVGMVMGLVSFTYSTFATQREVAELKSDIKDQLLRIEKKVDLILVKTSK